MNMTRRHINALFSCGAMLIAAQAFAAAQGGGETYRARLSVVPLSVDMQANVAGLGNLTATLVGNRLTVNGNAQGLRSPATTVAIHRGPKGIPGPAIINLEVTKTTSPTISGTLELTPQQLEDLRGEQFYVQLNSERAPEGNLRGWLLK
jgi:CHRD domain-containing protein